ncbi:hypothetical protein CWO91_31495 [Bradyrhizobium genosp. SA-3]|nr:hypothetical protein CWO91_31495 [Bradyrhizobium genosp. SA-3]
MPDPAVDLIAANAQNALEWCGSRPVMQRQLTTAEKDLLENRQRLVNRALLLANGQADKVRIERAVAAALTGYGKADQPTVAAYTRLLSDLPAWAVEQACNDIRRGAVVGLNPDFPPAAPRIHQIADAKLEAARIERDKLKLLLTAKVEEAKPKLTPEQRERMRALADETVRALTGDKVESEQQRLERQKYEEEKAKREEHARRMQYILQGYEPPTNQHGMTISMSVAMATGLVLERHKPASPPKCEFSPEE